MRAMLSNHAAAAGRSAALEESECAHFDALPRRGIDRRVRIFERGMRREACAAVGRRVEYLEHQGFIAPHVWEVEPALSRVVLELIGLAHTIGIAALGTHEIFGRYAARIDDRQRVTLDGR